MPMPHPDDEPSAGKKLLLAEDERPLGKLLKRVFETAGFSVRVELDGGPALAAFNEYRPDVVVLDVRMPEMDGYDVCRAIRKLDREIPMVFLSAFGMDEDQIKGLEAGADDYVVKTSSSEMIVARVMAAMARARRFSSCDAPCSMTKTEADIYRVLKSERGRLFSYREIFAAVVGEGYYADEGSLRSHISHLRKKLPSGETIEARRGQGFRLI